MIGIRIECGGGAGVLPMREAVLENTERPLLVFMTLFARLADII